MILSRYGSVSIDYGCCGPEWAQRGKCVLFYTRVRGNVLMTSYLPCWKIWHHRGFFHCYKIICYTNETFDLKNKANAIYQGPQRPIFRHAPSQKIALAKMISIIFKNHFVTQILYDK